MPPMIIDCHGHFTTVPASFREWRAKQIEAADHPALAPSPAAARVSDDEIRQAIDNGQLRLQKERGSDLTLLSPIAGLMSHHLGNERTSLQWAEVSNDLVHRVCELYPDNFAPVGQLPQSPAAPPKNSIPELRRIIEQLGFVGVNINPDPTGGYWTGTPMTDRSWYPLYEALCELDVPGMIHVASSCNPCFHGTGAHYINADTAVFMQLLQGEVFKDFPTLRLIIPHGGGAVPYHWGRYRGMSLESVHRPLEDMLDNIYFDTCVYHQPGVELLTKVVPAKNVLFGSEMIGAVRGRDPANGEYFDDTKRYVDACTFLDDSDRHAIFEGNARRVYPRLDRALKARGR